MHGKKTKIPSAFPAPVAIAFARNIEELNFSFFISKRKYFTAGPSQKNICAHDPKNQPPGEHQRKWGAQQKHRGPRLTFIRPSPFPANYSSRRTLYPTAAPEQTNKKKSLATHFGRTDRPSHPPRPKTEPAASAKAPEYVPQNGFYTIKYSMEGAML